MLLLTINRAGREFKQTRCAEWSRSRSTHLYQAIWPSCFQICNGCLIAACLREQENVFKWHFVTIVFFPPRILHSPFCQQGSRRRAAEADRKLNEIKAADRSDCWSRMSWDGQQKPSPVSGILNRVKDSSAWTCQVWSTVGKRADMTETYKYTQRLYSVNNNLSIHRDCTVSTTI